MYSASTACKHRVSGSLSLPSRGSFHLSFTVLYAIGHWVVFSLTGWSPHLQSRFHVSRPTLDTTCCLPLSLTRLSRSTAGFSKTILLAFSSLSVVLTPGCTHPGLGSSHFARRYFGNRCFFLFLRLLRCFSSPGSPCISTALRFFLCSDGGLLRRVSPFGHLRLNGYLRLPAAFRSLLRPSSALSA